MKVTVIVPIYNVEQYLRECLDSVISQTLADIEVICVNDGSIDKSQEILNEYSWKDARIKIINQINQGAYAARNAAIDIAQGDYLCFIDPDDYYPDKFVLENLYIAAINNNALICGGEFQENKSGTIIKEWSGNLSQYSFKKDGMVRYKDYQFEYGFHRFIYKTEFIKKNKLYSPQLSYYEDPVFFVNSMTRAKEFYALNRVTYSYRTGHKTVTWNYKKVLDLLKGIYRILVLAKENNYSNLMSLEEARILNDYLDPIYNVISEKPSRDIIYLLNNINKILYNEQTKIEYFIFKNKINHLIYDYSISQDELRNQLNTEKESKKTQNQKLMQDIVSLQQELNSLQEENERIINTYQDVQRKVDEQVELISNLKNTIEIKEHNEKIMIEENSKNKSVISYGGIMENVKAFLHRKDIEISVKRYGIDALGAMAQGLFCSLLIGTIINTLGTQLHIPFLTMTVATVNDTAYTVGGLASAMSGPAMAVAIGYALHCPPLVLFSLITVGFASNALGGAGGPLAVLFVAVLASEAGKAVSKETKVDILVTPLVTIGVGIALSALLAPALGKAAMKVGSVIMWATELQPFLMGILVSVFVGIALTLPISSAAICAALGLTGLAGGAAVAGCCAQMVGFAVMSFPENKWGGLVSQGIGTSMLQMGNIVKNPKIWIAPIVTSAITGPVATCLFHMEMNGAAVSSGMGTCGLVGQIGVYTGWVKDVSEGTKAAITTGDWAGLLLVSIILPAVICPVINMFLKKNGWVKEGDLTLK